MSWENDVYTFTAPSPKTDPVVKMALTPSAYRKLPENVEGHIAEYLLPRKIPAGTRGMKYRLPEKILADRRMKKEIVEKGREYLDRAQKRAYDEYMAKEGQAQMSAAEADLQRFRADLAARVASATAQRLAQVELEKRRRLREMMKIPLTRSAERRRQTEKSRARRGHSQSSRRRSQSRSQRQSKKPSKSTMKLRSVSRRAK